MPVEYLKKAPPAAAAEDEQTRLRVREIIAAVEKGGEAAAQKYAAELDGWTGDIIASPEARRAAADKTPPQLKDDIQFMLRQVRRFAEEQKNRLGGFQTEIYPGLVAGQKHMPVQTAGCYVPGGRYAHIASAVMSAATAKTAGAETVVACSPPRAEYGGIHPAVLYALDAGGADVVLNLGGAHGVAALAFGLFSGHPADVLAGPGNQFVAEAKRQLYGRAGIDMVAGPTEILVIADDSADADIVAADLAGQAEHGPNSPAWLAALSPKLGREVLAKVPECIAALPQPNRGHAEKSWEDYGEIAIFGAREEAAAWSDMHAPEHLEVHCAGLEWWLARLKNYGSLFLGEETTVAYGDKISGPNHILPTRGAARYTGGLSVA
ncbi:MAG: histidinol dehydrogenase, partial [Gammaproteobacteria bacterium]